MPKPTVLVLLASALVAGAAFALPPPVAPAAPWGVFSVSSGDGRETTEVEISSVLVTNTADARPETTWINEKTERVWVARKRVAKAGGPATLQWTDSRACYQLIETLATLIDLNQPAGGPPLRIDDTSDSGAAYRIEANGWACPLCGDASGIWLCECAELNGAMHCLGTTRGQYRCACGRIEDREFASVRAAEVRGVAVGAAPRAARTASAITIRNR